MQKQKMIHNQFGLSPVATIAGIVFLGILVLAGIYLYRQRTAEPEIQTVVAEQRDLKELVSVTGQVRPVDHVDLSFEVAGKVDIILAETGDAVNAGDSLVKLTNADLTAELSQVQATLAQEQARLTQYEAAVRVQESLYAELLRGATSEDLRIAETKVASARKEADDAIRKKSNVHAETTKDLENAYQSAEDLLHETVTIFDRILFSRTQNFFTTGTGQKELTFIISVPQVETDARDERNGSELRLLQLRNALDVTLSHDEIDTLLSKSMDDLAYLKQYLSTLNEALENELSLDSTTQATYSTNVDTSFADATAVQNKLSTQQQTIALKKISAENQIDAAESAITIAQNKLDLAEGELEKVLAGTTTEELSSQAARIDEAKANLNSQLARIDAAEAQVDIIRAKLAKTVLRSPIDGIITKLEAEVGETIQPQTLVVSISSAQAFEIIAFIPEVDIANVQIGQQAELTLDAYGPDVFFAADVFAIDPAETVIDGVSTYKVTLLFTEEDGRIKSGMTANIDILTDEATNVVAIPQRMVSRENGRGSIELLKDGEIIKRNVVTGLISWDGYIEIKEGLEAGEEVVAFIES